MNEWTPESIVTCPLLWAAHKASLNCWFKQTKQKNITWMLTYSQSEDNRWCWMRSNLESFQGKRQKRNRIKRSVSAAFRFTHTRSPIISLQQTYSITSRRQLANENEWRHWSHPIDVAAHQQQQHIISLSLLLANCWNDSNLNSILFIVDDFCMRYIDPV
jgi:hypothetical protein